MTETDRLSWYKRTEYDRTDSATRAQLLEAAERVFSEVGYGRASVARIADEAGVSRATFYVYFTSRQAAFQVLTQEFILEAEAAQRVPDADLSDPNSIIASTISRILELYTLKAGLLAIIEQQSRVDEDVSRMWDAFWQGQTTRARRFVTRLQRKGRSDPGVDAGLASESMTAVLLHYGLRSNAATAQERGALAARLVPVYQRLIGWRG